VTSGPEKEAKPTDDEQPADLEVEPDITGWFEKGNQFPESETRDDSPPA